MQFPKLTPLQSRFVASVLASGLLVVIYLTITNPKFADATDVDSLIHPDHNHPIIYSMEELRSEMEEEEVMDDLYEPEFDLLGRSVIGRAPAGINALANNDAAQMNIQPGELQYWVFPKEALAGNLSAATPGLPSVVEKREEENEQHADLKKRQTTDIPGGSRTLYVTMNVCLQPSINSSMGLVIPPQLDLYISQTVQKPGPDQSSSDQTKVNVTGGFATIRFDADTDVYIGVVAQNLTSSSGIWNYELAGSIDGPYHSLDLATNLYFVDGDNHAALLVTNDTTQADANSTVYQQWMNMTPPFSLFVHNMENPAILGLQNSYCGLKQNAQIFAGAADNIAGEVGMTSRGLGGKPKEQFYINSLNASSTYYGILAMVGNSTASGNGVVGGGGRVWQIMNFTTKQEENCALIYNLPFCSEVAYAVPASPAQNKTALISFYDDYASNYWTAFNYSLQQIPCNTTDTAQYSLARNCDDCAAAYKTWLCAVTIPRCEDFSSDFTYLFPRNTAQQFPNGTSLSEVGGPNFQATIPILNGGDGGGDDNGPNGPGQQTQSLNLSSLLSWVATNSSRNPMIDTNIKPGPYKEVLPCQDLCYDLVQSCPAALGFGCPSGQGLSSSYGQRASNGDVTCSYLGAAYFLSAGTKIELALGSSWIMITGFWIGVSVFWSGW